MSGYIPQAISVETQLALLQVEVSGLRADVAALTSSTNGLVDTWKAANKLVTFIKWAAGVATALAAAWAVVSHALWGR